MKKTLLSLFLITISMGIIKLNAYCFYNWSNKETITVFIYKSLLESRGLPKLTKKASYVLSPKGGKRCWNWKSIGGKRTKLWWWIAFKGGKKVRTLFTAKLGERPFPIGSAVVFAGYDENAMAEFKINYDGKPWRYWESPWKHESQPWKTFKRP